MLTKRASIIVICIVGVALLLSFCSSKDGDDFPIESHTAYNSQEECMDATGEICAFIMCDYVPEGSTIEETCGADFENGWKPVPMLPPSSDSE